MKELKENEAYIISFNPETFHSDVVNIVEVLDTVEDQGKLLALVVHPKFGKILMDTVNLHTSKENLISKLKFNINYYSEQTENNNADIVMKEKDIDETKQNTTECIQSIELLNDLIEELQ